VRLRSACGFGDTKEFDPFLLFDDFRNENPEDYLAWFPWHPHRGIETITYVLAGTVNHGGQPRKTRGPWGLVDVQWITAGSGILHQEMPRGTHRDAGTGSSSGAKSAVLPEDDPARATRTFRVATSPRWTRRRRHARPRDLREPSGGKAGRSREWRADPRYLDVWVPPGKRKVAARRNVGARVCLRVRGWWHVPRRVGAGRRPHRAGGPRRWLGECGRWRGAESVTRAIRQRRTR